MTRSFRSLVVPVLDQDVERHAVVFHRAVGSAARWTRMENFVQSPRAPDAHIARADATVGEGQPDLPQAQAEHARERYRVADDSNGKAVPAIAGGLGR
jgi:hypothetical protein